MRVHLSLLGFILSVLSSACAAAAEEPRVDFNYEIRPLLSAKCFHCHGTDEKARKAKLRLDLRPEALRERDGTRAIVPGDPAASEAIARITSKDPEEVMPPPKESDPLKPREAELIRRWIAQGAEYKEHWAWTKPVRTEVPLLEGRVAHPIDAFVRAQLHQKGLSPSPPADRATLLRRLSLDLIGLPPTPAELEAFEKDDAPEAYERVVDRLLGSPHFGEKWARLWLDLARYADSTGYGSDKFRLNVWPYRDWVINAFNRNLPYDQFTIEQLAGDLLPDATPEQIAATAFHRNTMTNVEGGTIDEEYRVAAVKDRIATTGQVWMGLTVGCAQCHTHKFDPISHTDYYRFFGVFNQTADADREDEEPKMAIPTAEERSRMATLQSEVSDLQKRMEATTPELEAELHEWEARMSEPVSWQTLTPREAKSAGGAELLVDESGTIQATGTQKPTDQYRLRIPGPLAGITALRLDALPSPDGQSGPGRFPHRNFVLTEFRAGIAGAGEAGARARFVRVERDGGLLHLAEIQAFVGGENVALKGKATQSSTYATATAEKVIDGNTDGDFAKGSVQHTADGDAKPFVEIDLGTEQPLTEVVLWNRTDAALAERIAGARLLLLDSDRAPVYEKSLAKFKRTDRHDFSAGKFVKLSTASADFEQPGFDAAKALAGGEKTGWAVGGAVDSPHQWIAEAAKPLSVPEGSELVVTLSQNFLEHTLGRFRLAATTKRPPVRALPADITSILAIEPSEREESQRARLLAYFRPLSKSHIALQRTIDQKRAALAAIKPVAVPVMRELAKDVRRETHLLNKGNYLAPGEKLESGLLSSFASYMPAAPEVDRLTAARWIMHPENPLTARVAVNRFWAQLFGTGLVETEEDFGTQGALPSHPLLLDWLAVTFQSPKNADPNQLGLGWNMKAFLRLCVTSDTYRQSSRASAETLARDPQNRLLSHATRRRLEAEVVRDQALALSGLLAPKIGGPSVYPPQPDGLWKVAFNGGQNGYPTSKGEDRYRRGLYSFWRRTMPPPSLTTFDAPSRESCTVRRVATNTPLQAFVTLNDPVFVECAQALARRLLKEGGTTPDQRIRWGIKLATGRNAEGPQIQALLDLLNAELAQYAGDQPGAIKLATSETQPLPKDADAAELAAWTVVANVLLNLDSVLTKG